MKWFKRGIFWVLGLTALLVTTGALVLALSVSWLDSNRGHRWIAGQIEAQVRKDGYTLKIESIRDMSVSHMDVQEISLADERGPILRAHDLVIQYDLKTLLARRVHLEKLAVKKLEVIRIPESDEGGSMPKLPRITVETLSCDTIIYKPEGTEKPARLSLTGALALSPYIQDNRIDLTLRDLEAESVLAALRFERDKGTGVFLAEADIHDREGGLIAGLLGMPSIDLSIDGQGEGNAWSGTLDLKIGETSKAAGVLSLDFSDKALTAAFEGNAEYAGDVFSGVFTATHRAKPGKTGVTFKGTWQNPDFTLKGLQATLDYARGGKYRLGGRMQKVFIGDTEESFRYLDSSDFIFEGTFKNKDPWFHIAGASLVTPYFSAQGPGRINGKTGQVKAEITVQIPDTARILPGYEGALAAKFLLSGNYKDDVYEGRLKVLAKDLKSPADDLLGVRPALETSYRYAGESIVLKDGVLKGRAVERLDFSGRIKSDFSAVLLDIKTGYAGYALAVQLDVTKEKLTARDIKFSGSAGTGEGTAEYHFKGKTVEADLRLLLSGGHAVTVAASGPYQTPSIKGTAKNADVYDITYTGKADLKAENTLTVRTLKGNIGGCALTLQKPWDISYEQAALKIGEAVFALNGGKVRISGQAGKETMDLHAEIENISANLGRFPFLFDGRISGDVALSGPYANPSGEAHFNLRHISISDADKQLERYADGGLSASLANNTLTIKSDLAGPGHLEFKADAAFPFVFSTFSVPFERSVRGNIRASVDLQALALLIGLDEHRITGRTVIDITLAGTRKTPKVTGTGALTAGGYENLLTGTVFRDITAQLTSSGDRVTLKSLAGKDLNGGSFSGRGTVSLADIRNPAYDFTLEAKRLTLVNLDRMSLTASGKLISRGDSHKGKVSGHVKVDQAEYYVTEILTTSPYSGFEIVEKGRAEAARAFAADRHDIALDVSVTADRSVYVRGPEMETEWAGTLKVGGSLEKPSLDGKISLVRGTLTLMDTPVRLTGGTVRFTPPDIKNPDLDVSGLIKGKSLDATLHVGGTAGKPDIALSSEPPYPEDEILARALFGTSVGQLSPVQALRIAQMLAILSGQKAAGFDPLAKLRQAIGVDTLSVSMEEEGAALSIGKYVSDRVYIAVDQGATSESSAVRAEIELGENIEVETKVNSTSETSIGVNWKRDY